MNAENEYYVFIDESGDPYLPISRKSVSSYYVITAVIVKGSELKEVTKSSNEVIVRYFQTGEMKSSKVGNNKRRRSIIINALGNVSFKHYSQIIDKSEILTDSGLRFKKSFVKFINRSIYQRLFQVFPTLHIIADEYGASEFMREFGYYIKKRIPNNLFETSSFEFGDSKNYPLIQVGDMIAGTIARVYAGIDPMAILNGLKSNTIIIDEWPPKSPKPLSDEELARTNHLDLIIRRQAVQMAARYIDEHSASQDFNVQAQITAIRYLLYFYRSVDPERYIPTSFLHNHLNELGYEMSERLLRSNVIGSLRDNSVFIVSSNKGIKIPYNSNELLDFTYQVNSRVMPYLRRLKIIRNYFLLSTNGEFDMASEKTYPNINQILEKCV